MAANIGDICSRTFQLRNNNIRQRNHRTEKISAESSLKQWKVNYVLSSPVNNSLLYIFRRLSGTQNRGGVHWKISEKKGSYKCFRTESSKSYNFSFTHLYPTAKTIHIKMNNTVALYLVKKGTNYLISREIW